MEKKKTKKETCWREKSEDEIILEEQFPTFNSCITLTMGAITDMASRDAASELTDVLVVLLAPPTVLMSAVCPDTSPWRLLPELSRRDDVE